MLTVVGTVPCDTMPIISGTVSRHGEYLVCDGKRLPVNRGTAALLAAAAAAAGVLGTAPPVAVLVGDTGVGAGSRKLYKHLVKEIPALACDTLVFHYLQPVLDWHNRVLDAVERLPERPVLIADAGFMYVAKMSGRAGSYNLFTPDAGELAFLADEEAPHPFYTRGFILHEENRVSELIERAYRHNNAARYLLVKGKEDVIADRTGIVGTVSHPVETALEAIGGTGDTLTGIVATLIDAGMNVEEAAVVAMMTNRHAGALARPTPATQITDIIDCIPQVLQSVCVERAEKGETDAYGETCGAH